MHKELIIIKVTVKLIAALISVFMLVFVCFSASAETVVGYRVRHYVQQNGSEKYQYMYLDRMNGEVGSVTEAQPRNLLGYKVEDFTQTEILADGSTIVAIYYTKAYDFGDVNCDGVVDMLDMAFIERYLAEWDGYDNTNVCSYTADCYINNKITANDALLLKRYLAGIKDSQFGTLPETGNKEDGFGPWV